MEFLAVTSPGVEGVLAKELSALHIKPRRIVTGGVEFAGGAADMMRANLQSRVANRIVVRFASFHASTFYELERRAKKVEWERFLSRDSLFHFRITSRKSKLYHSDAIAERLGLAASRATGAQVLVSTPEDDDSHDAAQLFVVRISQDEMTISVDTSGEILHRRGYRQAVAKAPLRETLAAAMLHGAEWDATSLPLIDPMCGSGTIPIEAAMIARGIPPGIHRRFAFENFRSHDERAWVEMKAQAIAAIKPEAGISIIGSDRDAGAIDAARANAQRAGVNTDIEFSVRAISAAQEKGIVICNPPYGERVGEPQRLRNLYAQIGKVIRAGESRLGILSADRGLEAAIGLELTEVFRTSNGGIPVRFLIS
jgi:putative N6-adenine-specific DNA methylase